MTDDKLYNPNTYFYSQVPSASNIKGIKLGVVEKVEDTEYLVVDVRLLDGEILEDLPWHGAQSFYNKGPKLNGILIPPQKGMYVAIGFVGGKAASPVILNTVFIPAESNEADRIRYENESDKTTLKLGHYCGSILKFYEDGVVSLDAGENQNVNLSLEQDGSVNITGPTCSLSLFSDSSVSITGENFIFSMSPSGKVRLQSASSIQIQSESKIDLNAAEAISLNSKDAIKLSAETSLNCEGLQAVNVSSYGKTNLTSLGDINIQSSAGTINLEASGEDQDINLKTTDGNINIEASGEEKEINIKTADGNVNIEATGEQRNFNIAVAKGELNLKNQEGTISIANQKGDVSVQSVEGNVKVESSAKTEVIAKEELILNSGDASAWKPNVHSNCIFSGAPHSTISKLHGA